MLLDSNRSEIQPGPLPPYSEHVRNQLVVIATMLSHQFREVVPQFREVEPVLRDAAEHITVFAD